MANHSALVETVENLRKQVTNYHAWAERVGGLLAAEYRAQAESTEKTIADLERLMGRRPGD
jgi:hypothetical protein